MMPGTYTITAGADDGCGVCGNIVTKRVTVTRCPVFDVICPPTEVSDPIASSRPGEYLITFNRGIRFAVDGLSYIWSVDNGEIVSGQDTPTVIVKIPPTAPNVDVVVSFRLGGLSKELANCDTTQKVRIPRPH